MRLTLAGITVMPAWCKSSSSAWSNSSRKTSLSWLALDDTPFQRTFRGVGGGKTALALWHPALRKPSSTLSETPSQALKPRDELITATS
jgi:hypothetical protein